MKRTDCGAGGVTVVICALVCLVGVESPGEGGAVIG